ncbi:hypothetical protein BRADI_1g06500v3, partial [Brachypodium distachyon]
TCGKRVDGLNAKPLKPSAKPSARKALRDVSNTGKPLVPNICNGTALKDSSVLKEKSTLRSQEAIKNPVKKATIFADEMTKKCHEWAKDGVESTHFTGNDAQKLDDDKLDKRVKKKVEKIMSALHDWPDVIFDPVVFPSKTVATFYEEVNGLELEPEILPDINRHLSSSRKFADCLDRTCVSRSKQEAELANNRERKIYGRKHVEHNQNSKGKTIGEKNRADVPTERARKIIE